MRDQRRRPASASPDVARAHMQGPRKVDDVNRGSDGRWNKISPESIAASSPGLVPTLRRLRVGFGGRKKRCSRGKWSCAVLPVDCSRAKFEAVL
jgi:hypothetical protein